MSQNRSHAVMSQRIEPHDSLDFFPTPRWATRALCERVLMPAFFNDSLSAMKAKTVWEPACGDGAMAGPLSEYFGHLIASDVHAYGYGTTCDFLLRPHLEQTDWIITNPPFRLGKSFAYVALDTAKSGVALLVRTAFLESAERFALFRDHPPALIAQYVERVPMVKGRLQRDASTATAYCWIIWHRSSADTRFRWIEPCKKQLDRDSDWPAQAPATSTAASDGLRSQTEPAQIPTEAA